MVAPSGFHGFPREAVQFFENLIWNNNRAWFQEHKEAYQEKVLVPAVEFVRVMGERLRTMSPGVVADTRTNGAGSIFRIYRDVRFSKDKRPYKTYLGVFFQDGARKKMENPGFYFHTEPGKLMLAAGWHEPPRAALGAFRDAVVDPELGPALADAVEQVRAASVYEIGGRHYKRAPRGYDPDHPNAQYLLYNGLFTSCEGPIPDEFYSDGLVDYCAAHWAAMHPIHAWTVEVAQRVSWGSAAKD